MTPDHARLRALAEAARDSFDGKDVDTEKFLAFSAHADPDAVLSLLEEIERLRTALAAATNQAHLNAAQVVEVAKKRDEAVALLREAEDALRTELYSEAPQGPADMADSEAVLNRIRAHLDAMTAPVKP